MVLGEFSNTRRVEGQGDGGRVANRTQVQRSHRHRIVETASRDGKVIERVEAPVRRDLVESNRESCERITIVIDGAKHEIGTGNPDTFERIRKRNETNDPPRFDIFASSDQNS